MKNFGLIGLFMFLVSSSFAQIINIENQRIQNDTVRKVFNVESNFATQRNNELTLTEWHIGLVSQVKLKNTKDMLLLLFNNDKSIADKTVMNNASLAHIRCSHKLNPKIKVEAFYQIQTNELLALRQRQLLGSGFRFKLLDKPNFKMYLGTLYMYELESTTLQHELKSYHRNSNYFVISGKLDHSKIEFSNVVYYQPLFANFNDFRFTEQFALSIPLSKHIFLTTNLTTYLDTTPPEGVSKYTYAISQGLRYMY